MSRKDKQVGLLLMHAVLFSIGGLFWWPLCIPAVLCMYFGFMLACFT